MVSYCHADKDFCQQLVAALQKGEQKFFILYPIRTSLGDARVDYSHQDYFVTDECITEDCTMNKLSSNLEFISNTREI
jgi:hypothetical protein